MSIQNETHRIHVWDGGERVPVFVTVTVDFVHLAAHKAQSAYLNKSGESSVVHGAVTVKVKRG